MIVDTLVTSLGSLFQVSAAKTSNAWSPRRCRLLHSLFTRRSIRKA